MEPERKKKESLFASIFPRERDAQPIPGGAPAASAGAKPVDISAALNTKIETAVKSISETIERRLSEFSARQPDHAPMVENLRREMESQSAALNARFEEMAQNFMGLLENRLTAPAASGPVQESPGQDISSKIGALEDRLKELADNFRTGAAQMRSAEESKTSARREIEELLKVVREQQKYSELDRNIHEQLEKAWARVEAMEKRLVDAYGLMSKRSSDDLPVHELAAELSGRLDNRLQNILRGLESVQTSITEGIGALPPGLGEMEKRYAEMHRAIAAGIRDLSGKIGEYETGARAEKERLAEMLTGISPDIRTVVRESLEGLSGTMVRHLNATALEKRDEIDSLSTTMLERLDRLEGYHREEAKWAKEIVSLIGARLEKAVEEIRICGTRDAEVVREAVSVSADGLSGIESAAAALSEAEVRISAATSELRRIFKNLEPLNLEVILGVSGTVLRRELDELGVILRGLENDSRMMTKKKTELEAAAERMRSGNA